MKKRHIIYIRFLFLLIVGAASCSKHGNVAADNGCIERVIPQHTETTLRTTQIDSIMALFSKNNISTDQLQFIQFIPNIYVDPVRTPQAQVRANLFVNGLPVFRYNEVFVFNDGIFDTAYLYTGAPLSNDTTSHRSITYLRSSFLQRVSESVTYSSVAPPFIPSSNTYTDKCLVAMLGYVDAVYIPEKSTTWGVSVKVWAITPLNSSYPSVFVEDDNGLAWGVPLMIP
jgi:hypothetical protein